MTQRVWPPAVPLEPDARVLPAPLAATLAAAGGTAPVTLLVAGRRALETGWSAPAAVALAEAWSRDGTRLVLADLSLGAAALEKRVDEPNDEGLADVFFYGASLKRVIRTSNARAFGFIPAGEAPVESRDLLTDAGWRQVIAYFFRESSGLLAYVPWSAAGLSSLAARLGAVIALADPADLEELESVLPPDAAVLALVVPPTGAPPVTEPVLGETGAAAAGAAMAPPDEARFAPPPTAPSAQRPAPAPAREAPFAPPAGSRPDDLTALPPEAAVPVKRPLAPWELPTAPEVLAGAVPPPKEVAPAEPLGAGAEARAAQTTEEREERRQRTRIPDDPREALVEALWARRAGGPARQGLAPPVDPVPGRKVTEKDLLTEPPTLVPAPVGRRWGLSLILWPLLGAAVVVGFVFAYQAYQAGRLPIPVIQSLLGPRAAPAPAAKPAPVATTTTAAPVAPVETDSLPYSVAIEARPEYPSAAARASTLSRENPDVSFFVTPMLDRGAIYYHVMAGPVPDSAAASALMQRLVDEGVKTGASLWDVVPTRLAFDLGDFPDRSQAEQRGSVLTARGIPTYPVEVAAPDGSSRWRLYAGAFQGVADAAVLRPLLKSAGLRDSLVLRTGRVPR